MVDWDAVVATAGLQHDVLARWQLRCLGVSPATLEQRVANRYLMRDVLGTYWMPGRPSALRQLAAGVLAYSRPTGGTARFDTELADGRDVPHALYRAALGAGQCVCGVSAAWLHGFASPSDVIWLRLPGRSGHAKREGVALRYGRPATIDWVEGIPCTSPEQSVLDIAAVATGSMRTQHHRLAQIITTADRKRITTVDAIARHLDAAGAVDGAALLGGVLEDLRGGLSHSATEARAREIAAQVLTRYGLQLHPRPHPVELNGRIIGEADLAVLDLCYDIEIDGPHHELQIEADRARDRLMREAGWTVDRIPVSDVDAHPGRVTAIIDGTVRQLLQRRGSSSNTRTVLKGPV